MSDLQTLLDEMGVKVTGPMPADPGELIPGERESMIAGRRKLAEGDPDGEALAAILKEMEVPAPRGAIRTALAGAGEAMLGTPGRIAEGVGIATGSEDLQEFGQSIQPREGGILPFVREDEEGVAANVGRALGSGLAMAPAAALGGPVGVAAVGAGAAAQSVPDAFYAAKAAGEDDDEAYRAALWTAIPQGAIEVLAGPERLIGKIASAMAKADKLTGGAGKDLLWSAAGEGVEEGVQSLWGDAVAQALYDEAPDEDWKTILGRAAEQSAYGVAGGLMLGAVAQRAAKYADEDLAPPKPPDPDRTPPVYDPVEREITVEESEALEDWKAKRGATRAEFVERADMADATELARKAGAEVLFVDDDGTGAIEAQHTPGRIILPASADAATTGLEVATHEAIHALPLSEREALIETLGERAAPFRKRYADKADAAGQKITKKDLDEEGIAELSGALAPVIQRVMRNEARALKLMTERPGTLVKVLDAFRKVLGRQTHTGRLAAEIDALGEVRDTIAKGMSAPTRVKAAQMIVQSFKKIEGEMRRPVKPKGAPKPAPENTERALVPIEGSERTKPQGVAAEMGARAVDEKKRGLSREVESENALYTPSGIALGPSQDFTGVSDEDLIAQRDKARETQESETDLALRGAGFNDLERAKYRKARRRAIVAQRAVDSGRGGEEAVQERDDAARRLRKLEARVPDIARARSGPDPEVFERELSTREAKRRGRFVAKENKNTPGVRYSLASDAGADGDVAAARKAWKEQGTKSPWFQRWFGSSKVVDAKGEPLVVYHGAPDTREMNVFQSPEQRFLGSDRENDRGFWFTSDRRVADTYADDRRAFDYQGAEPGVLDVYLSIQNPLEIDAQGASWKGTRDAVARARAGGHDGLIIRNVVDDYNTTKRSKPTTTYAVLKSEQIKSATGNLGTFDPKNPDIRYSLRSDIEREAQSLASEDPEGYQLANAGDSMPERVVRAAVRSLNPVERKTAEESAEQVQAILSDRSKREDVMRRAVRGESLNDIDTVVVDRVARLKAVNAWRLGASMENAVEAEMAYQQARTNQGRALGSPLLRDTFQTPAERAMKLLLSPSKQARAKYMRATTAAQRKAIIEQEARKVERVRYSLQQRGIDPSMIPDDYFKDPAFRREFGKAVADGKTNGWDWYIQWRRAAMLSGPITTVRNVTGNTSYVTYDRMARLWADSVLGETTVGDAAEYTHDIFAGLGAGWDAARAAYRDFYDSSTDGTSLDEQAILRRGPILTGLEAIGVRAQSAQDHFFRTVVGQAETRLRARQKARNEGGTAEDYMHDPDVLAMSEADMERALFLDRDEVTRIVTRARDWADSKFPIGSTIVPFAATPTKIVQRGAESLLGPLGFAFRDREKWGTGILGAGMWAAMIWAASQFDDEDGLPLITGSRGKGAEGDFQDRAVPAYSIRIGDTYYSYQSIEPLSTALAAVVDGVRSDNPLASVQSFATAAKDKSFFRSVETVYDAIVGAKNGERGADRAKQVARDLLWTPMIPNAIRAPLRASDEDRRKELGDPLEAEDFANAAIPTGDFGPPLRHDLWGRPVEKDGGTWVQRVLSPMLETGQVDDIERIDLLLAKTDKFFSAPAVYVERDGEKRYWTEDEYAELTRDAGARALAILRPWAERRTELTEKDLDHIQQILSKTRARKVKELLK